MNHHGEGPRPNEALPELTFDRYQPTDRDALVAGVADIQEVERELTDTRRPGAEMGEEYFEDVLKNVEEKSGAIFIARADGKIGGFIACWIETDDDIIQTEESRTYGYISDVWVAPEFRDQGLFAQLSAQAETYLKQFPEAKLLRLRVVAKNARALAAYEKDGFEPEEIQMVKRIS